MAGVRRTVKPIWQPAPIASMAHVHMALYGVDERKRFFNAALAKAPTFSHFEEMKSGKNPMKMILFFPEYFS